MSHRVLTLTVLACALALGACKRSDTLAPAADAPAPAPAASSAATAKPTAPADDNLNAVLWVQTSAEYQAATTTVYRAAADRLDVALNEKNWDALVTGERGNPSTGLPAAVVMDVDETVLDNSPYQARLVSQGKEYDEVTWDAWVAEKKAKAVPGVVEFAKAASAKGVTILYLSNRAVHLKDATIANLKAVGMPVKDDSVFLGLGTVVEGCEQNGSEKDCRRRLAGQQYRVLNAVRRPARRLRAGHGEHARRPLAAAGRIRRLVRRALVHAPQPDLRQLGAGAVQQRLGPAARSAPRGQARGVEPRALISLFEINGLQPVS
ncbi:5'-nucleotidase (lipoprotein e(P4) family) [Lysobacter sp. OAE881]